MATIRAYTTIEQGRKLAEILPLESADMWWSWYSSPLSNGHYDDFPMFCKPVCNTDESVPCWSLVALLGALRVFTTPTAFSVKVSTPSLIKTENGYKLIYVGDYTPMINNGLDTETPIESVADNPIDACYEMIIKLNELNLL